MSEIKPDAILSQNLLNAQVGVLGSLLIDGDLAGSVLSHISAKDFQQAEYRAIYQAIQALFRDGIPVDAISVREKLGGNQWTELLKGILEVTPTAANVDAYVKLLKESSMLYQMQTLGEKLASVGSLDEAKTIIDKAMQIQVRRPGIRAMTFAEGYSQFFDRHSGEDAVEFLDWPIVQLNGVIKAELGNIVIIGAYPGDGKTAFALQCAAKFGLRHNVGYFSFESKKERLYDRHVSRTALLSSEKINANQLTEDDFRELLDLKKTITAPQVTLIDAVGMTALDIVAYSQAQHYDVIIVDYIQQVEHTGPASMKDFERVTAVSQTLQKFAVRTDTTVIALSQLSRPDKVKVRYKDQDGDQRVRNLTPPPTISDLRSSGQIEQDADIVLLMWREDYELQDSPRVIQVAKNRNGPALDKVRCKFDGDHQTFSRIDPRRESTYNLLPQSQKSDRPPKRGQQIDGQCKFTEVGRMSEQQVSELFPADQGVLSANGGEAG